MIFKAHTNVTLLNLYIKTYVKSSEELHNNKQLSFTKKYTGNKHGILIEGGSDLREVTTCLNANLTFVATFMVSLLTVHPLG